MKRDIKQNLTIIAVNCTRYSRANHPSVRIPLDLNILRTPLAVDLICAVCVFQAQGFPQGLSKWPADGTGLHQNLQAVLPARRSQQIRNARFSGV
jgi:hypothetical protein